MHEVNVLVLLKGSHRFVYIFDDQSRQELSDVIAFQASDSQSTLSWFDAVVLNKRIKSSSSSTPS